MSLHIPLTPYTVSDINPFPSLFKIAPNNHDHEVGIRFGISMMLPLLLLYRIGRMDLAMFTIYMASVAVYGKNLKHRERLPMQLAAGILMFTVMMAASAFALYVYEPAVQQEGMSAIRGISGLPPLPMTWMLVTSTAVAAFYAALCSGYLQLRPTGCMFHIFAFASIVSTPVLPPIQEGAMAAIITLIFTLSVGVSSRLFSKRARKSHIFVHAKRKPLPPHRIIWGEAVWYFIAASVSGAIAASLAEPLGLQRPHWAMVASVVPLMGHSTRYRINRGFQRVIGTFMGTPFIALILLGLHNPWLIIFSIGISQIFAESFMARNYAIGQMFAVPVAMLSSVLMTATLGIPLNPKAFLFERIVETILGSIVGVLCVIAPYAWRRWVRKLPDPARYYPRSIKEYSNWRSRQAQANIKNHIANNPLGLEDPSIPAESHHFTDGLGIEHAHIFDPTDDAEEWYR